MAKDDFSQEINLCCQRERLTSDTCFSSSNWQQSCSDQLVLSHELSFPAEELPEQLSASFPTTTTSQEEIKDTTVDHFENDTNNY